MNKRIKQLPVKVVNRLCDIGFSVSCIALAMMTIATGYEVVMRRIFGHPTSWSFEVSALLFMGMTLLAVGQINKKDQHIRMDFLSQKLSDKAIAWKKLIESILGILYCSLVVWKGTQFAISGYHYRSMSMLALPLFPVYILIPIGFSLWGLQYLVKLSETVKSRRG